MHDNTSSASAEATMPHHELTIKDDKSRIQLAVGKTATIRLQGNPTTGYSWTRLGYEKSKDPSDENLMVVIHYKSSAPSGMVGASGQFFIDVTPKVPGTHKLELVYIRPFEGIRPDSKSFRLAINSA